MSHSGAISRIAFSVTILTPSPHFLHLTVSLWPVSMQIRCGQFWQCYQYIYIYEGGADMSLARPTSRCRKTELIVSLERGGLFMCRICKSFLVTEAERKHVRRRARFQQHRDASCHQNFLFFSARQGAEGNSRHSDRNIRRTFTIICHRQKLGGPV